MDLVEPLLYNLMVKQVNMTEQRRQGFEFKYYKYALYATDVKFQPSYRPSGRLMNKKIFFRQTQAIWIEARVFSGSPGYCGGCIGPLYWVNLGFNNFS